MIAKTKSLKLCESPSKLEKVSQNNYSALTDNLFKNVQNAPQKFVNQQV